MQIGHSSEFERNHISGSHSNEHKRKKLNNSDDESSLTKSRHGGDFDEGPSHDRRSSHHSLFSASSRLDYRFSQHSKKSSRNYDEPLPLTLPQRGSDDFNSASSQRDQRYRSSHNDPAYEFSARSRNRSKDRDGKRLKIYHLYETSLFLL